MSVTVLSFGAGVYALRGGSEVDGGLRRILPEVGQSAVAYFADVLRRICEDCGPSDSRHLPERIYLEVRPGDKCEAAQNAEAATPTAVASRPALRRNDERVVATIFRAENGWILKVHEGRLMVFEYDDEPLSEDGANTEHQAFARVLRALNEHCGPSTNRYSAERVYVEIRPGDKHGDGVRNPNPVATSCEGEEEESEC